MRFASPLLGMLAATALLAPNEPHGGGSAAAGGAGGAGDTGAGAGMAGGAGAASAGAGAAAGAAVPAVDVEKIKAETAAATLAALGFKDAEEAKQIRAAHQATEDAKLTEKQRQQKLLDETLDARGKAEKAAADARAEVAALNEKIATRDKFDTNGVAPAERGLVDHLYSEAKTVAGFDEAKWFAELREKRPYFFASAAAPAASTTTKAVAGATGSTVLPANQGQPAAGSGKYDHLPWVGGKPPDVDAMRPPSTN